MGNTTIKDKIGLYSIVMITHLEKCQSVLNSNCIGRLAIVREAEEPDEEDREEGDESEFMLTYLDNGNGNGWWAESQLKLIYQIDSVSIARKIFKRCNEIQTLVNQNIEDVQNNNVLNAKTANS